MPTRYTLDEAHFRWLVDGQIVDVGDIQLILEDIGFDRLEQALREVRLHRAGGQLAMGHELPPVTVTVCVPCWRDIYGEAIPPAIVKVDLRRVIVRQDNALVIHRRVMLDPHVVGVVCGNLNTHAGVVQIGLGG
ncbi:MAG: hypothetical protein AABY01_04105 [Nanoarchaeota archaeon]